jgi:hypothetical protein
VVPFSEVITPKLKQFIQNRFAAVEGFGVLTILTVVIHPVGVLTILTLVLTILTLAIHPVCLTSFLEVHLRAIVMNRGDCAPMSPL